MKSMKLYDRVNRIHNELAARGIGPDAPLSVAQLTPFDQYNYFGTEAVDRAIAVLGLKPGMKVLDIGSGIGGPARYIADRTGAHVTALELQSDLNGLAGDLTRRCGLSHLVDHRCGNVLDGLDGDYDAILSLLCFLHIADRERLFAVCRSALKPDGILYIEDYGRHREASEQEAETLAVKVQCPYVPTSATYRTHLADAGFARVNMDDVTADWARYTSARLEAYRSARVRNIAVHGAAVVDGLDDFYGTVEGLFRSGLIAGLRITAR
jgi:cyclopropane fatty-acyl-phospholipid synthase-like methyltransferase